MTVERSDGFDPATPWRDRPLRARVAVVVAVAWSAYTLLYLCKVFFYLGIVVYPLVHRAIATAAITTLVFLYFPPRKGMSRERLHLYDVVPIVAVVLACGYVAFFAQRFVYQWGDANALEMVLGVSLLLALVEASRRTAGWLVSVIVVAAFFYIVYSDHFPGFLMSVGFSYPRTVGWIYLSGEGLWGMIIDVVSTLVAAFIIFGAFLEVTGASRFFTDLAFALVGSFRGGPAKVAVVASTFFGTISGSVAANVATTGQLTIPLMIRNGYSRNFAGAVEAVASTGGMFTPPIMGATAFLIAEFLGISYWRVCLAAAIPALIYYLVLFAQVDLEAARTGIRGIPRRELPGVVETLRWGWPYLVPFGVLVALLVLEYSTETAILYTLASLVVVGALRRESRLTPRRAVQALERAGTGMMPIVPVCTAIGTIVGAMTITGAGANLSITLQDIASGNLFVMLLLAASASFILGMGMPAITCYILTVVLIAPGLVRAGVDPLAAHMFLFYFGCVSFITPPVAIAAYVASAISKGSPLATGTQALMLGAAAFLVPWGFVYAPSVLLIGPGWRIILSLVFLLTGGVAVAVALSGYLLSPLSPVWRALFGVGGLGLFTPVLPLRLSALGLILVTGGTYLAGIRRSRFQQRQADGARAELLPSGDPSFPHQLDKEASR